ncbi:hypothetical protein OF83DRAFT_1069701 [Amylostereum chailletii]|nr:hypothetical protein OF83DRAFT_1069701 [Amylostereum chailletii]
MEIFARPVTVTTGWRTDSNGTVIPSCTRSQGDYWVAQGRHFGRTVYAMCSVIALLQNGLMRLEDMQDEQKSLEDYDEEEVREHDIFKKLLRIPRLKDKLGEDDTKYTMKEVAGRGIRSSRADDTKSLKSVILDWLMPDHSPLYPHIPRNNKSLRGFNHPVTGEHLCPTGYDWSNAKTREALRTGSLSVPGNHWPVLLYVDLEYDPNDPWNGFMKSKVLVYVQVSVIHRPPRTNLSGNAAIHGMVRVTKASLAYVPTQARFCLLSATVFSQNDKITDSERFYNSLLNYLNNSEEQKEVSMLLKWWDRYRSHLGFSSASCTDCLFCPGKYSLALSQLRRRMTMGWLTSSRR